MGIKIFLLCIGILNANAVSGCPLGREFITTFMPNNNADYGSARPRLTITAHEASAVVTVEIKGLNYRETLSINRDSTSYITLPARAEIGQAGVSAKTVLITSNTDISVVSSNIKPRTGDSSVIFPNHQLGKSYVAFTPEGPSFNKIVAIVNGKEANTINILPYSNLQLQNNVHLQRGMMMSIKLGPYEVYLLQSMKTLTGTKIESQFPVAVLGGHECLIIVGACEHVYEQLVPIELLSDEYLVPPMHGFSNDQDNIHVIATEDNTDVTVFHGPLPQQKSLSSGELLDASITLPTVIRSNKKIMVMLSSSNLPNDEFLTNIIPVSKMSKTWTVYGEDTYDNYAVVVSEQDPIQSILGFFNVFPANKKYGWAIKPMGKTKGPFTITGDKPQAVYVYGGKRRHGYATTGVCNKPYPPPPPPDPCESVQCGWRQTCKNGVCVNVDTSTCWATGDPHYRTFDGKLYDFQGSCTYTMATTVKTEKGLVPFTVLAKNNRRGSNLVAYVRTVSLNVYNHIIVASKTRGVVEVDGEITYLPVHLAEGKIQVVQSGWNVLITTDFGLEVKYDWNMMLYITVPSTYFGSLGGLCGNYNGDLGDELLDPKGGKLATILLFAKSWKVSDNDLFCHDDCQGKCLLCSPELKETYSANNYCGLMAEQKGPFAKCHKTVDPRAYLDNCVYDVCINRGIRRLLCENMQSYAEACMAAGVKIEANWRILSECPLQCPVNSHYEPCGTACPASCADQDAPSKCEKPCLEGCQCNKGFVLSGDQCVALAQCGCTYKNRYYIPGVTFWGDHTCNEKCSCISGQVKCVSAKCKKSEECKVQNGVKGCYPLSYGNCVGTGDPHYLTFDRRSFDFQGTCTYYLSKLVDTSDKALVPFEVLVKNENRGQNKAVSYTKTVEIKIFGYTIIMTKDYIGKVLVNNLFVNLPFETEDGQLSIFRSGYFGVVQTNFGMKVKFNWQSYVDITLPSTYSNLVGGLCGNWNGNTNDDMAFPNKVVTTNPTAFGNSWKARNDFDCSDECKGQKCPKCDAAEKNKDVFTKPCSLITDTNGPFKECHSKINPTKFYEDCVYDLCMYGGHSTALCGALTAYTAACQEALIIVKKWRTDRFCPASCKANSHYDVCGAGCPQTCNGFTEPTACQRAPCTEGCVCDDGFVLSDSECVPMERCGCVYEGQYYNLGQAFYPKGKCSERCVCEEQGKVTCKNDFFCGPNEQCEVRDGVQACYPDGKGSCSVSGSGIYNSYDGNQISVQGNCLYRLVETVQTANVKIIPFSVTVQEISSDIVVTRRININLDDYMIALIPGHPWEIRVDDVQAFLPVTLEEGLVKVYQGGAFIILETSFGLKVTYDTVSMATVELPSTYKNAVQGLCGNYNDKKADDLLTPDRKQASSAEKFVEAWQIIQKGVSCHTGCPPGSKCPEGGTGDQTEKDSDCKILTSKKGPFSNCHSKIPPSPFYDACVKDVVSQPKDKTLVCRHLQNYVVQCQQAGISISSWRNAAFCPMTCPEKSHYELCADTCKSTCASLTVSPRCSECLEGCQCDEGFVFDGGDCKLLEDCGCLVEGRYYKSGQSVVRRQCTETCTCKAGQFSCQSTVCKEEEVCRNQDGVPACVFDPCIKTTCRQKENCVEKNKKAVCVPTSKASCLVTGDHNYQTFDGNKFTFQGACSYVMVRTAGADKTLTEFTIINENKLNYATLSTYINSVTIKFHEHEITIVQNDNNKVIVDGKKSALPVDLDSKSVTIIQSGNKGILKTDFGLEVTFDWAAFFNVTVSSSYFDNIVGMCGTYSDNREDDFVTPDGSAAKDNTEWGQSWSIPSNDFDCLSFRSCSEEEKRLYSGPEFCGLLEDETGPFANCKSTINLNQLKHRCLFYTCLTRGNHADYCKALTSYSNLCNWANTAASPNWREIAKCCK